MDFVALPPEITSALIHSGPGAESLIEASGGWQQLGTGLEASASAAGHSVGGVGGLPRVFRTADFVSIYAASCEFRYSARTSCGVR